MIAPIPAPAPPPTPPPAADEERQRLRLERLLLAALGTGLVLLLVVGIATVATLRQNLARTTSVLHAYRVQVAIGSERQLIEQSENARRGYAMTGDPLALRSWRGAVASLPVARRRLDGLLVDPAQRATLVAIDRQLTAVMAQHAATNALAGAGHRDAVIALYRAQRSPTLFRPLRGSFAALQRVEAGHIAARTVVRDAGLTLFFRLLAVVLVLVPLLLVASLVIVLRYTRALGRSRADLRRLNDHLEDEVVARTADLTRANEEIQRFAYIVSHDLRSPLVNVMGFTAELSAAVAPLGELIDRVEEGAPALLSEEARLAAREDLPEAIGFIRSSTQKMDRLINAILKLSREGRRVIAAEPLDLAQIADGAIAAIRHVVDDRGVAVTVERPMPAVTSDRLAIEQILSNLIENATKYLAAGRPGQVVVSAAARRGRVVIAVADNGRGIAAADHQRIFDLFRRSGMQDQPGEGIGLAHVRALAYRLGGTIDVESVLGEGATFRLSLPETYQPPQDTSKDMGA